MVFPLNLGNNTFQRSLAFLDGAAAMRWTLQQRMGKFEAAELLYGLHRMEQVCNVERKIGCDFGRSKSCRVHQKRKIWYERKASIDIRGVDHPPPDKEDLKKWSTTYLARRNNNSRLGVFLLTATASPTLRGQDSQSARITNQPKCSANQ